MSFFPRIPRQPTPGKKTAKRTEAGWEAERERAARNRAAKSRAGRDIAPIPAVVDPARKEHCRLDFDAFCRTYFPETFTRPWSSAHRTVIRLTEEVVLHGGKFADALPRGYGKTSLAERGVLWASLYGHRQYPFVIGAGADAAEAIIETIKSELENNDLLYEDFPEVCHPIRRLEGVANRANAQHCAGKRTLIEWGQNTIVLPTIAGSAASGVRIRAKGITGAMRGQKITRSDGKSVRPDLMLLDDPQTDESAHSASQNATRLRVLRGAVLGMAGHGKRVACLMPCTVIAPGDMVDQLLNRDLNPDWMGVRTQMIEAFPANAELWDEYRKARRDGLKAEDKGKAGNDFYLANLDAMRAGAKITWPECKGDDDVDALQYAMNLKSDLGDEAFAAEYQNAPLSAQAEDADVLTAEQIASSLNGLRRGEVPDTATKIVAFIDVQKHLLYWVVCAIEDDFTGYVIDYGSFPDQRKEYFACRDARKTVQSELKTASLEETLYQGLERCTAELLDKRWKRDDGSEVLIDRCLIDANWGESTDIVKKFCRESVHAARLVPSHGMFAGASGRPFDQYREKTGDEIGDHWRRPKASGRQVRHVAYDTNHWKSFLHARLAVAAGGRGRFSLFGDDPQRHRLLADHLTAEEPVKVTAKGRTVTEWKWKPSRPDNHWLDCLTGCCVAASMLRISLKEREAPASRSAHRVIRNVRFNGSARAQHG